MSDRMISSPKARGPSVAMRKLKRLVLRLRGPLLPLEPVGGTSGSGRLSICPACRSRVVIPVDWHENDESSWWVRLRCGECAWSHEAIITDAEAERLERDLAPGLQEIAKTVEKLDLERMRLEADIFVAALTRDLIGPCDFSSDLPR